MSSLPSVEKVMLNPKVLLKWKWFDRALTTVGNSCDSIGSHKDVHPPRGHVAQVVCTFRVRSALQTHVKSRPETRSTSSIIVYYDSPCWIVALLSLSEYQNHSNSFMLLLWLADILLFWIVTIMPLNRKSKIMFFLKSNFSCCSFWFCLALAMHLH